MIEALRFKPAAESDRGCRDVTETLWETEESCVMHEVDAIAMKYRMLDDGNENGLK